MNIEIGDIVVARNRYGKMGRYIVTRFGKRQATFRGVFVVSTPRESERPEEILDLGDNGYALLTHAYSDLIPECVRQVVAKLGEAKGNQIEQLWKSARKGKKTPKPQSHKSGKKCFDIGRYTPTSRALPRQVSRFCSGGMVRPI